MKSYEFTYVELGDTWGPHERNNGGFKLNWGCKGVGFGELVFFKDLEDKLHCDNECMPIEFVRAALAYYAGTAELIDP